MTRIRKPIAALAVAGTATAIALLGTLDANALGGSNAGTAITAAPGGNGYAAITAAGGQYNYGASQFTGSLAGKHLNAPIVDAATKPGSHGTWMTGADGGVFAFGGARFYGSMAGRPLNQPVTAIVGSPSGNGYLLVGRDGGTFAFGDYVNPGSLAGKRLNAPVADAVRGLDNGLWMVAEDGGVFAMSAPFYGAATDHANPSPVGAPITGGNGGNVRVPCPGGGSIVVAAQLGDDLSRLLQAAKASGHNLCGSGWRDSKQQVALRVKNCGSPATNYTIYDKPSGQCQPPTARPGTSMHEKGLAVDFNNCGSRSTACWKWLNANAANFGLRNLPDEPWHWSTTGR